MLLLSFDKYGVLIDKQFLDINDNKKGLFMGSAFRLGTELVAAVVVGTIIGFILDNWFGTKPWLLIIFFTLLILDCTCDIGFMKFLGFSEGFELQQPMVGQQPSTMGPNPAPPTPIKMAPSQGAPQKIVASEALGENEDFASVSFKGRTPATCYPQDTLKFQ